MRKSRFVLLTIAICAFFGGAGAARFSNQGIYFCDTIGVLPFTYSLGFKTTVANQSVGRATYATTTKTLNCMYTYTTTGL